MKTFSTPMLIVMILIPAFLCTSALLFIETVTQGQEEWDNRYSHRVDYGTYNISRIYGGPQVFWDNETNNWEELLLEDHTDAPNPYYLLRNAHITAKVGVSNKWDLEGVLYYDPDYTRRVCAEYWIPQAYLGGEWVSLGTEFYSHSVYQNATFLNVTGVFKVLYNTNHVGWMRISYILRPASFLKHEVICKNITPNEREFGLVMKLIGIAGKKVIHAIGEDIITINETQIESHWMRFVNASNPTFQFLEEKLDSLGHWVFNETSGEGEWINDYLKLITVRLVEYQGKNLVRCNICIGNFTLAQNEYLTIDPTTSTFYTSSSDGYISKTASTYSEARDASSGTVTDTLGYWQVGQNKITFPSTTYYVWRPFVFFDTSSIGAGNVVTDAILGLYGHTDASSTNFNITVQNGQPTYPHDPLQGGDYDMNHYGGDGGTFDTLGFSVGAYNNITLTEDGEDWINMTGDTKFCLRSSRDINNNEPNGLEYVRIDSEESSDPAPFLEVTWEAAPNAAPTNDSASITDMDDTDNLYAQKQLYTGASVHSDTDGYADIDYCEFRLKQAAATRAIFRYDEDTDTFSTESGSTEWTLDGSSSAVEAGNSITITWKFVPQWDAIEEADGEIECYVVDDEPESDTDTMQTDYWDVVTNLVTAVIECTDPNDPDRVDISSSVQVDFTVRYANNPGSGTASDDYPPDAEFTSVSVYDSVNNNKGTDNSIVNGAGSVTFNAEATVKSENYNLYIDMADADYVDAEETETEAIISDRIVVYSEALNDSRVDIGEDIEGRYLAVLDYDDHSLGAGDTLSCSWGALTWDAGNAWWDIVHSEAGVTGVTISGWSGSEATYVITEIAENITETTYIYDRMRYTFSAQPTNPHNYTGTFITLSSIYYEYDGVNITYTNYQVQRNGTNYLNIQEDAYFGDYNATTGTIYHYTISSMTETYGLSILIEDAECWVEWVACGAAAEVTYTSGIFVLAVIGGIFCFVGLVAVVMSRRRWS